MPEGGGKTAALHLWEVETINSLGWSEARWIRLSLQERARKVVGHKLGSWMQALEAEKERQKIQARYGSK